MADDVESALFSPAGAVLTDPADVERALALLWKPADAQDGAAAPAATRVSAANLLVVASEGSWPAVAEVLGELSPTYPTRTIVVLLGEGGQTKEEDRGGAKGAVRVSVSALCHVPQPGQQQVCCEQIVLHGPAGGSHDIDRTILPLLETDLPTMAWWTVPTGSQVDLLAALYTLADRLIVDAGLDGVRYLKPIERCITRELGWYRTCQWRQWVASLFDGPNCAALDTIRSVGVRVGGGGVEDLIDAFWLVSFFAGQLGWRARGRDGEAWLFRKGAEDIRVVVEQSASRPAGLEALSIVADGVWCDITRCGECLEGYRITEHGKDFCRLPRCVEVAHASRAKSLAVALTGRHANPAYERASRVAAWMAGEFVG